MGPLEEYDVADRVAGVVSSPPRQRESTQIFKNRFWGVMDAIYSGLAMLVSVVVLNCSIDLSNTVTFFAAMSDRLLGVMYISNSATLDWSSLCRSSSLIKRRGIESASRLNVPDLVPSQPDSSCLPLRQSGREER